jgi:hypothetical protein
MSPDQVLFLIVAACLAFLGLLGSIVWRLRARGRPGPDQTMKNVGLLFSPLERPVISPIPSGSVKPVSFGGGETKIGDLCWICGRPREHGEHAH